MKGRILFFMIGLLPFLFPCSSFAQYFVFYKSLGNCIMHNAFPVTWTLNEATGKLVFSFSPTLEQKCAYDYFVFKNSDDTCSSFKITQSGTINVSKPGDGTLVTNLDSEYLLSQGLLKCGLSCPDTDKDGLCDACDEWPNDPKYGSEIYTHGQYVYQGKTVAYKSGPSKNRDDINTVTRLAPDRDGIYNRNFPGYTFDGLGSGSSYSINNDQFIKGGGKILNFDKPELLFKYSCPDVESIDQCNADNITCKRDYTVSGNLPVDIKDNINPNPSPEESSEDSPQVILLDKPYIKPIPKPDPSDPPSSDPCPEHRALCSNSCGGSRKVSKFACAGTGDKSHVFCSCDFNGGYEFAPNASDIGDITFKTATSSGDTSTSGTIGSGTGKDYDPSSVGSGTDDLNQDGDATNDLYGYAEGQADFTGIRASYGRLTNRFPFTLADSFIDVFRPFSNAQGSTPTFSYSVIGHTVNFDLSPFDDFARFVRSMFALGLTLSTIASLIYIWLGVDFRKK